MRVAILDDIHSAYEAPRGVRRLRERAEIRIFPGPFGEPRRLRGFDGVGRQSASAPGSHAHCWSSCLTFASSPRPVITPYHIDLSAATERGVIVAKATGGFSVGAAELAIGLAIALMRQIPAADRALKPAASGGHR